MTHKEELVLVADTGSLVVRHKADTGECWLGVSEGRRTRGADVLIPLTPRQQSALYDELRAHVENREPP